MKENCLKIARNFQLETDVSKAEIIKDGYINDTYLLRDKANRPQYVLQRINTCVFKNPEALAANKQRVAEVLSSKGKGLVFIAVADGKYFYRDKQNGFWMMSKYIPDSATLAKPIDASIARKSGFTIGRFHQAVAGESPHDYHLTLPDFHHLSKRYSALQQSVQKDTYHRASGVSDEIRFLEEEASKYFFLDDDLNGDTYYKISRSRQNLHRARVQIRLYTSFLSGVS